jgi:uncharacterized membrane protein YheB (UPF0754 family)
VLYQFTNRLTNQPLSTLQGLFLTRQKEVSTQFAQFIASKVLTSSAIWKEVLHGPRRSQLEAMAIAHADEMFEERCACV